MTLVIIMSAKKGDLKAAIPGFEASLGSFRFVPARLAKETTFTTANGASFATSTDFAIKEDKASSALLASKDGAATIRTILGDPFSSDIEKDLKEAEKLRAGALKGYKPLGTQVFAHETLGMVSTSDYEADVEGAKKHVHELAALVNGKRVVLTCAAPAESWERWRPAFERAVVDAQARRRGEAVPSRRSPRSPRSPRSRPSPPRTTSPSDPSFWRKLAQGPRFALS